ncbi:MAG: DUF2330 domain-containing protein [Desulfobacterales bacterium]|nr:DUF2330 domain-containing protein [Desulfobacterales bacterium]
MMKSIMISILTFCIITVFNTPLMADRGYVFTRGETINIQEPAQRAIIAHNGFQEILILQTDVKAERKTRIAEFMPLPSKPSVSLAPKGCFKALADIIKKHGLHYGLRRVQTISRGGDETISGTPETIKIVISEQIGPHKITVAEVKDADDFMLWVQDFFRKNKMGEPFLKNDLKKIVADYLRRGIHFFAFDIIDVSPEMKTVQPLSYEFKSGYLYYPMKVTNLYGGNGIVEIFTILDGAYSVKEELIGCEPYLYAVRPRSPTITRGLHRRSGLRHFNRSYRVNKSSFAPLSPDEMRQLHPVIPELMKNTSAFLNAVKYEGRLTFKKDLWAARKWGNNAYIERSISQIFLKAFKTGNFRQIEAVADVPFAFDQEDIFTDKKKLMRKFDSVLKNTEKIYNRYIPAGSVSPNAPPESVDMDIMREFLFDRDEFNKRFISQYLNDSNKQNRLRLVWLYNDDKEIYLVILRAKSWEQTTRLTQEAYQKINKLMIQKQNSETTVAEDFTGCPDIIGFTKLPYMIQFLK